MKLMHEQATQELSAARQKHSLDNSKIFELTNNLTSSKLEHQALQRFAQDSGDERYAVLSREHRSLVEQSHAAIAQQSLLNTQLEATVGSLKVSNEYSVCQVREKENVQGQMSLEV